VVKTALLNMHYSGHFRPQINKLTKENTNRDPEKEMWSAVSSTAVRRWKQQRKTQTDGDN